MNQSISYCSTSRHLIQIRESLPLDTTLQKALIMKKEPAHALI
ncbi:MAG: hypothetical protein AB8G77_19215 [Rhodothermales bacterium]